MSSVNLTRRPLWLAYVGTPLLTPVVFFLVYAAYFMVMGYDRPGLSWVGSLVFMYLFGVPVGYVTIATLGWLWIASLIRWKKLTAGYVCGGACIIGMVAFFVFAVLANGGKWLASNNVIPQLGVGSVIGLLSGLIFCVIGGVQVRSKI